MKALFIILASLLLATVSLGQHLPNVYFDFDKSNIRPGAEDTLKMVLKTLEDHSHLVVEVRGHADAIGSNDYNDELSARRAQNTIDYLANNGVDRSRMVLRALGENEPAADNMKDGKDNPEGRQLNRRVEFRIIDAKDLKTTTEGNFPSALLSAPTVVPTTTGQKKELSFWTLLMFVPFLLILLFYLSSVEG